MDAKIITSAIPAATSITSAFVSHRRDLKMMERKAELDKEIIEERSNRSTNVGTVQRREREQVTEEHHSERTVIRNTAFEEHLSMIRDGPPCQYCQDLLSKLVDEPPDRRRQGVEEVAELKQLMLQKPSKEEMQNKMREFDVLPELTLEME